MFKKILLIGTLCIGLMALMSTGANAFPSGWGGGAWIPCYPYPECLDLEGASASANGEFLIQSVPVPPPQITGVGIDSEFFLRRCANSEVKPSLIKATVQMENVEIWFWNPSGWPGGEGVNFDVIAQISAAQLIFPPVKGKGNCEAFQDFSPEELLNAIPEDVIDLYRPNDKWLPYAIVVHKFTGVEEVYNEINDDCEENLPPDEESCSDQDAEEVIHAIYPNVTLNNWPQSEGSPPLEYTWDEPEVWEWSNKYPYYDHDPD
jgi:hypothetical protein